MTVVRIISQPKQVLTVTPSTVPQVTVYDTQRFLDWKNDMFTTGEKITGRDAGLLDQESRTDDYIYKCVKGGDAGVAIWKKFVLFESK